MTIRIARFKVESNYQLYEVSLYADQAAVSVIKTKDWGRGGNTYKAALKYGSATFKRVLRDAREQAAPGSMRREHLEQCADTRTLGRFS